MMILLLTLTVLFSLILTNSAFAGYDPIFYGKGTVIGEHFTGGVMWTAINGDEGIFINTWELGRTKIHAMLSPMDDCDIPYKICLEALVINSNDSVVVSAGDEFTIKIDPENKTQVITGINGFLKNVDVVVGFTKIYEQ